MILCGGDFDSFEVTLADAVFGDDNIRSDLLSGLSIHTVMGQQLYPEKTLEQILASKEHKDGGLVDMYTRGKQAVFAMLYGGDAGTINKKLSIKMAIAEAAFDGFQERYPGIRKAREANQKKFGAMVQEGGIGTAITWHDPDEYCETFLGFRRYFTLENLICKTLYNLAHNIPKRWHLSDTIGTCADGTPLTSPRTCNRRDRTQTLAGAASSAIYGAAFQLQAANKRAADNHLIQSPGAIITKALQAATWAHQPHGIGEWYVAPMNIHDEVMVVAKPELADALAESAALVVESFREKVPLIALSWEKYKPSWGEKLDDEDPRWVHIRPTGIDLADADDPEADLPTFEDSIDEWAEREDDDE